MEESVKFLFRTGKGKADDICLNIRSRTNKYCTLNVPLWHTVGQTAILETFL